MEEDVEVEAMEDEAELEEEAEWDGEVVYVVVEEEVVVEG